MTNNVGRLDAAVRWTLAVVFFAVAIVFREQSVVTFGSVLVALVMAGTATTRICPLYTALGFHTGRGGGQSRRGERPAR